MSERPNMMNIKSLLNPGELPEKTRSRRSGSSSRATPYILNITAEELRKIKPKNQLTVTERGAGITNPEKWAFEQTKEGAIFLPNTPGYKESLSFEAKKAIIKSKTQSNAQNLGPKRRI